MSMLGWKLLGDSVRLEGKVQGITLPGNSLDGDFSVYVVPDPGDPLLSHDGVTNTDGVIECENRPTGDAAQLTHWLQRIPLNSPVTVAGPWVSDCGHGANGSWTVEVGGGVVAGIDIIETGRGVVPSALSDFLDAI